MNIFKGLPDRRAVLSWGSFDLANQSFTLLINTLLFGIFVQEVVMAGHEKGSFAWSLMGSISLGFVALTGPILGAVADAHSCKKKFLIGTGFFCAALTAALCLLPSGAVAGVPLALTLAFLVYVPANIAFNVGENFLASFLPEIATRRTMGRASAIGWTMGYVGALVLLLAMLLATAVFEIKESDQFRPLLLFAGLWFALMIVPTILYLPEKKTVRPGPPPAEPVRTAFRQFGSTIREASRFRDLAWLLGSFLIYGMGVQVVIFFAGIIARDDFGFTTEKLFGFSVVVTLMAGVSAFSMGMLQDRIGHKPTVLGLLALWTAVGGGLAVLAHLRLQAADAASFPEWPVWLLGIGIGLGLGGIGTATRAAVGVLTPAHRTAEFFGLWGTAYKLAGVPGLSAFGWVRSTFGAVPSLTVLTTFFLVGGLMVWRCVDMHRGARVAEEEEDEFAVDEADLAAAAGIGGMGSAAANTDAPEKNDASKESDSSDDPPAG